MSLNEPHKLASPLPSEAPREPDQGLLGTAAGANPTDPPSTPINEARSLLEKITPGEWIFNPNNGGVWAAKSYPSIRVCDDVDVDEDGEFIAAAPRVIRQLTAKLEEAEGKAGAFDEIDKRGDDALNFADAHLMPGAWAENVWHAILDRAITLTADVERLKSENAVLVRDASDSNEAWEEERAKVASLTSEVTRLREALRLCVVEMGWLIKQTKSREGGSVDRAYKQAQAALAPAPPTPEAQ